MCGIAGWISARPLSHAIAARMANDLMKSIESRGPDGRGTYLSDDARVGIVHTRLAIIDPQARSDQPMRDVETGCLIAFNGEIYNFLALRDELTATGVRFQTTSDTEVILRGYISQGAAFFTRLRGMYAFVLFDPRHGIALCLRDPFGIKPLYLGLGKDRVMFGSAPHAAVVDRADLDPAAAVSVAVFGAVVDPISPYIGVDHIAPGVLHTVVMEAGAIRIRRELVEPCWPWSDGLSREGLPRLDEVLGDSVDAHFTSDVPVAVFQSAGLDSSLISALATRRGRQPTLITVGFDAFKGSLMDEVGGAANIAAQLGLPHRSRYISKDEFASLAERFLGDMRTPTADGFNTYLAAYMCRELGFKVALSGVGADELFAGYPSFRQLPKLKALGVVARSPTMRAALRGAFQLAWRADPRRSPKLRFMADYLSKWGQRYMLRRAYFVPEELGSVLQPEIVEAGLPRFLEAFDSLVAGALSETVAGVRALELNVYMRNVLLRDADWAGMAHGVEVRTPFVDIKVIRSLCDAQLNCGYVKGDLQSLARIVEPNLSLPQRPKTGFLVPHDAWSAGQSKAADPLNFGSRGPRAWNRRVLQHWFGDWALP